LSKLQEELQEHSNQRAEHSNSYTQHSQNCQRRKQQEEELAQKIKDADEQLNSLMGDFLEREDALATQIE